MINKINIVGAGTLLSILSSEIQSLTENFPYYRDSLNRIFDPKQKYSLEIDVVSGMFTLQPNPPNTTQDETNKPSSSTPEDPFGCQSCNICGGCNTSK